MAIGFGKSTTGKKDIIKSLEKSYLINSEYLVQQRREWDQEYSYRILEPFSETALFTPHEYSFEQGDDLRQFNPMTAATSDAKFKNPIIRELLQFGYWGLMITQDERGRKTKHFKEWDFSINVWCGNIYAFHPNEARNNILRYHGPSVYKEWKRVVKNDLVSFSNLLAAYNPPKSLFSVTCCASSANLCRQLSLPVSNGFAFLTHEKGKICKHKTGTFSR